MGLEIPKTWDENMALIRKVLDGTATTEEITLAKNLPAIKAGVLGATQQSPNNPAPVQQVSAAILRDAEIHARQYKGTDIDSEQDEKN